MIALHGGLTTEMVYGMGGGFIGAAICFVYAHYKICTKQNTTTKNMSIFQQEES